MTFDYLNRLGKFWKRFSPSAKRRTHPACRAKRHRLEFLEDRSLLATVTWDGGAVPANFNWLDANNWNTNTVPTIADDVVIPDLTGTPTILIGAASSTAAAKSITSQEALNFTNSTFSFTVANTVHVTNATVTLSGARLVGGAWTATNGSMQITSASGTLDGVTLGLNTTLRVGSTGAGNQVSVLNNLTLANNSVLRLERTNSSGNNIFDVGLNFSGNQTIGGSGVVELFSALNSTDGEESDVRVRPTVGGTLTIGSNITVRNATNSFNTRLGDANGATGGALILQGTVLAQSANQWLAVSGTSVSNSGTLAVTNGTLYVNLTGDVNGTSIATGTLSLSGAYTINQAVNVPSGGLVLQGDWTNTSTIHQTGGTIHLGGTFAVADLGTFTGTGGTVSIFGTLSELTNTTLAINSARTWQLAGGTIRNVSISDNADGGAVAVFQITNRGSLNTTPLGASIGTFDAVTLGVNTTLRVGTTGAGNQVTVLNGLTLANNSVLRLERTNGNGNNIFDVGLNFSGSQTLGGSGVVELFSALNGTDGEESDVRVRPTGGGTLTIGSNVTVRNATNSFNTRLGDANGTTGGALILQGTVLAQSAGQWLAVSGTSVSNSGTLAVTNGTLYVNLTGDVNGTSIATGELNLSGTYTINQAVSVPSGSLTLGGTSTINQLISVSSGTLNLAGDWTNANTIHQTGGTINLGGTFTLADMGTFTGSAGAINITGTLSDAGATLNINAARTWRVAGGTLQGVTVQGDAGALLQVTASGTLNGVTLGVNTTLREGTTGSGNQVTVLNGLTLENNSTLRLERPNTTTADTDALDVGLNFSGGAQTLGGTGIVELFSASTGAGSGDVENVRVRPTAGGSLTIGPNITVRNAPLSRRVTLGDITLPLILQGTVLSQSANATGFFNLNVFGSTVTNTGTLQASAGIMIVSALTGNANQIVISDAGEIQLSGTYTINQRVDVPSGALTLGGDWNNASIIHQTGGTINLPSIFTVADMGVFTGTGGTVIVTGTLDDTASVTFNAARTWQLSGGTLRGVTIQRDTPAALLQITSAGGTLDGVTLGVNTTLLQGASGSGNQVTVLNGLTLANSSVLRLERNSNNSGTGLNSSGFDVGLNFSGAASTLGGNGVVELFSAVTVGPILESQVRVRPIGGGTLTIGPNVTVRNAATSKLTALGDAAGGALIVQGTVLAQSPGQTLAVRGTSVSNTGTLQVTNGVLDVNNLAGNVNGTSIATGTLDLDGTYAFNQAVSVPSGALTLHGAWNNASTITQTGGTINLDGTFSVASLGVDTNVNFAGSSGTVSIIGTLSEAANTTLALNSERTWQLAGGTIQNVTLADNGNGGAAAAFQVTSASGTLDGVTLGVNTTLLQGASGSGNQVTVLNGLTLANSSVLRLERNSNNSGTGLNSSGFDVGLNFSGAASTLGGNGVVELFSAVTVGPILESQVRVRPIGGGTLTIGPNVTVRNAATSKLTALGDAAGGALIVQGTVLAQSPGQTLAVRGTSVSNTGTLQVTNGVLDVNNLAGNVNGTSIATGTLDLDGTYAFNQAVSVPSGALTLHGAWNNASTITQTGGTINLDGTFSVASLGVDTNVNFAGSSGTVSIIGTLSGAANTTLALNSERTWQLAGGTIQNVTLADNGNGGAAAAFQVTSASGTLDGVTLGVNTTLLQGASGSGNQVTVLNGLTLANSSVLRLERNSNNSGTGLNSSGFDVGLNFSGAASTLGGNGVVELFSAVTIGPILESQVRVRPIGGGTLTIGPNVTVRNAATSKLTALGDAAGGALIVQGTVLAQSPGQTLAVRGTSVSNTGTLQVTNGVLDVNNLAGNVNGTSIATGTLDLDGTYAFNQAVSVPSGALTLHGAWNNASTITQTGGTINLDGTFSVASLGVDTNVNFAGSSGTVSIIGTLSEAANTTLALNSERTWQLAGGTIQNVTLADNGNGGAAAAFQVTSASGTLDGVTLGVNTTLLQGASGSGNQVTVLNGLTLANSSVLRLERNSNNSGTGLNSSGFDVGLNFSGAASTLGGNGVVELFSAVTVGPILESQVRVRPIGGGTLTIGPNVTVRNAATSKLTALGDAAGGALIVQGTVLAQSPGQTLAVRGTSVSNTGILQAAGGGTLQLPVTPTNFSGSTLTGGTWKAVGGGILRVTLPTTIAANAAAVVLDGGASRFYRDAGTTHALAGLNLNSGSLTLANGYVLTTADLTNQGTLLIDSSSRMQPGLPNLVSLWSAEGTASDAFGVNHGTLVGGATANTAGVLGQAFRFDGLDDYVSLTPTSSMDFGAGDFTLGTWFKLNSLATDQTLIHKVAGTTAASPAYLLEYNTLNNALRFRIQNSLTNFNDLIVPTSLVKDEWNHVAAVRSGNQNLLYLNGVLIGSQTAGTSVNTGTGGTARLGRHALAAPTNYLNGYLDEATLYGRALSAAEIANLDATNPLIQAAGSTSLGVGGVLHRGIEVQGGSLVGTGTIRGDLLNESIVAPGNSPGSITVNGNYDQTTFGTLEIELAGTNAATPEFDQLVVNGDVALDGLLDVSFFNGYTPTYGSSYQIITNNGPNPIGGTFTGLTEHAGFSMDGVEFVISYVGGDGNDVVLFAIVPIVVTNTNDSGLGSLRQAILDANSVSDADPIIFNIPGAGVHTIAVHSPLPPLTAPFSLHGSSQPGYAGTPLVELNGASAGGGANGLEIRTAESVVQGLVINRFAGAGILVTGAAAHDNLIVGNYLGSDASGTSDLGNGEGVRIAASAFDNTLGGNTPGTGNVIGGNTTAGVTLVSAGTNNAVVGNYIGTAASGTSALGNGYGIQISGSGASIIGGATASDGNIISGNFQTGITVATSSAPSVVSNNRVGLDLLNNELLNGNGALSVLPGGRLQGNPTLTGDLVNGGTLSPGNSPGIITINGNYEQLPTGTLAIELAGTAAAIPEFDQLIVNGNITLAGLLDVSFLSGFTADVGDTFQIITNNGPFAVSGTFLGLPEVGVFTIGGVHFSISYFGGDGNDVVLTAIAPPEIVGGSPHIFFENDSVVLGPAGQLDLTTSYFVDTDSTLWGVEVDYGDGVVQTLPYFKLVDPAIGPADGYAPNVDRYGFLLQHEYRTANTYQVAVTVRDLEGNVFTRTMSVGVPNEGPTVDLSRMRVSPPVGEGQPVSLGGNVIDVNAGDSINVTIAWGDGTQTVVPTDALRAFGASHQYADGGSPGIPVTQYSIQVTATDSAGGSTTTPWGRLTQQVDNAIPTDLALTIAPAAAEGQEIGLGITFNDSGVDDSHLVTIDWGDGTIETRSVLPAATPQTRRELTGVNAPTHRYQNLSGATELHTIRVSVADTDEFERRVTASTAIDILPLPINVSVTPTFAPEGMPSLFDIALVDSSYAGPHSLHVAWGDGSSDVYRLGTATSLAGVSHVYLNNSAGGYTPRFVVERDVPREEPHRFGQKDVTGLVANDVPAIAAGIDLSHRDGSPILGSIHEGDEVALNFDFLDDGILDTHVVTVDWGDGTTTANTLGSGGRAYRAVHRFVDESAGVQVVLRDEDNSALVNHTLAVQNIRPTILKVLPDRHADASLSLTAEVFDPGPDDTLHYSWELRNSGGLVKPQTTVGFTSNRRDQFDLPANLPAGVYTLSLAVHDNDDPADDTYRALLVVGTSGDDTLAVTDAQLIAAGVTHATLLGLGGNDTLDASALTAVHSATLDGGSGNNILLGGRGNDTHLLTFSTQTVIDAEGDNTLDFSRSDFGVQFDLSLVPTGTTPPVLPQDVDLSGDEPGEHLLYAAGSFTHVVGTAYSDSLTADSNATLEGGSGSDNYYAPLGNSGNLTIRDTGSLTDISFVTIASGSIVTGLNYEGGNLNFTNAGTLDGVTRLTGDGSGAGGGYVSFTNLSTGTIYQPVVMSGSGSTGIIFQNSGTLGTSTSSTPILNITGDGSGAGGGYVSFTNLSTGTIYQPISVSTSGSTGVIFQNSGALGTSTSSAPIVNITGDGSGAGGGFVSFTNLSGGTIYQPVVMSASGSTGVIFQNSGALGTSTSSAPIVNITGDGSGAGGGFVSFTNLSTGTIYQPVVMSASGSTGVIFQNSGTLGASTSSSPIVNITGDGSGAGGGFVSFTNLSTGTIYQPVVMSASGSTGVIFQNSGTLGASTSSAPIVNITGDGSGAGGGFVSFTNLSTGTIYQPVVMSASGSTGVIFQNSGTLGASTASAPIVNITGDGSGAGGGFVSFTNLFTGTIYQPVVMSASGSTGIIFQNSGTLGTSTSTAPIVNITGDGSGAGGGFVSFTNLSTGTIYQPVVMSASGSTGVIFQNSGTLGTPNSSSPIVNITGDGSGAGGGFVSFTNLSTGTIYQPVVMSASGSTGVIFQNSGTLGTSTSSAPIVNITGDGSGAGGGFVSFTNLSTGTIYQPVVMSASGSTGVIFQNSGTLGTSTSSAPIVNITGDGSGAGGGFVSFTNLFTGTIYQPVVMSASGSTGVIFQNSGTLGTSTSSAPIVNITGDGSGAGGGYVSFINQSAGTIYQPVVISASGSTGVVFQNTGTLGTLSGSTGAILTITGDGSVRFANFGEIFGVVTLAGGGDDLSYTSPQSTLGRLVVNAGGGSNTFTNLGSADDLLLNAADGNGSTYNLLVNRGSASASAVNPALTMMAGAGFNALNNFATGTGFLLTLTGQAGPDLLYNEAPALPHIDFAAGSSPDRGVWSFPLGDVLHNLGDDIGEITFAAADDSSPDWLLNAGASVHSVHLIGGFGYNLLENYGPDAAGLLLEGSQAPSGQSPPSLPVIGGAMPLYATPAHANTLFNFADGVSGLRLVGGHGLAAFVNTGADVSNVELQVGDGALQFFNAPSGENLANLSVVGGALADYFRNDAAGFMNFTVSLGAGDDLFDSRGASAQDGNVDLGDGNNFMYSFGADLANVEIFAGSGNDVFDNRGPSSSNVSFQSGGSDDVFRNDSQNANGLRFDAGAGDDTAVNFAAQVALIEMFGGDGHDRFYNLGDRAGTIHMDGGSGDDTLQNLAAHVERLILIGGSDSDGLYSARAALVEALLDGGTGADVLNLEGGSVTSVTMLGGLGNDAFRLTSTVTQLLRFLGEEDNDAFDFGGVASTADLVVDVQLGNGDNIAALSGALGTAEHAVLAAGSGSDRFVVTRTFTGAVELRGGDGDDTYYLSDAAASVVVDEKEIAAGLDMLDFSNFHAGGVDLDLAITAPQTLGPLTFQLTDGLGIENVVGTAFADGILGNARPNQLAGASYQSTPPPNAAIVQSRQWIYIDFDTFTTAGEHVYSPAERDEVVSRINLFYRGPTEEDPWFDVLATRNAADLGGLSFDQFVTVYVNAGDQSGGEASEIDPGNRHAGGWADVQVNGLLGGDFNPPNTIDNFVKLTAKIAAHEVGHLLGLWHPDAVGPLSFGNHLPFFPTQGLPEYDGAPGAFETISHVTSSPATVGSDRFSDLGELYFGEREALKLALGLAGSATQVEYATEPSSPVSPRDIDLVSIAVPNTLANDAFNSVKQFAARVLQVDGSLATPDSSDYYRFSAQRGQILTAEAFSQVLTTGDSDFPWFDTQLELYDSTGTLVARNDNSFEVHDSRLADFVVPLDGLYTIAIRSGDGAGGYRLLVSLFETFSAAPAADVLQGKAGVDTFDGGPNQDFHPAIGELDNPTAERGVPFERTLTFVDLGGYAWTGTVNYGDGTGDLPLTIDAPAKSFALTHQFATARNYAVTVTLRNDDGLTDVEIFSVNVTGEAEPPTIVLTGASEVHEAVAYELNLGAVANPGGGITAYAIDWGDGFVDPHLGNPASQSHSHTYADGDNAYSIRISLTNSDGTFAAAGSLELLVKNVAPTLALSGAETVHEGALYTLNLYSSDPGDDAISQWIIDWGDGIQVVPGNPLSVTHAFADGLNSYVISASATDEDGTFTAGNTVSVEVQDVAPVIALTGAATVREGSPYTLNLGVITEPGVDTVTGYFIDWGEGPAQLFQGHPTGASHTHTYADGGNHTIRITLIDEDGAHTNAGTLALVIEDVAPILATSGASSVNEGAPYTLNLSSSDPGTDTITHWIINWGDGTQVVSGNPSSVTHIYADGLAGYTISATATNEDGDFDAANTVSVAILDVAPTLAISGASSVNEGSLYTLNLSSASDPGTDTITHWTINWGDGTQVVSGSPSSVTHIYADGLASYTIGATATNEDGAFEAGNTVSLVVRDVTPTLAISGASSVNEGSLYTLNLSASDPGTDTITHWTINWGDGTQVVSGSPSSVTHIYADGLASYTISATATNEDGTFDAGNTVSLAVLDVAPTLAISGPSSVNEGAPYTLNLSSGDPGTETITHWTINWGDSTQVVSGNPSSVTHIYADGLASYTIGATAISEDGAFEAGNTVSLVVRDVAPTLAISGASSVNEGSLYTLNLSASDPGTDTITHWIINWGDGPQVVSGNPSSVAHIYADGLASYTISATATSEDGAFEAGNTVSLVVRDVTPTLAISGASSVNEGSLYTLNLSASDPGADTITHWTINWGDGMQVVSGSPSSVTHIYADGLASYTISAMATNEDGAFAAGNTVSLVVLDVAPTLAISGASSVDEGSLYTLNLSSASDPGTDTITQWTINWGDGTQVVSGNPSSVTHIYADGLASYTIGATATSEDGTFDAGNTVSLVVRDVAPNFAPVLTAMNLSSTSINEDGSITVTGTFTDSDSLDTHRVEINWGAGEGASLAVVTQGSGGGAFTATHKFRDDNPTGTSSDAYTITATVIDDDNGSAVSSRTVTVKNVAPVIGAITGPASAIPGQSISYSASFADIGKLDTHTAFINWGDGTTGAATVTETIGTGTGAISGNHTYANNGAYTITLTLKDDDLGSANKNSTLTANASIFVLNATAGGALTMSGNGSLSVPGVIVVDSNSSTAINASGNAALTANQIHVVGSIRTTGNAQVTSANPLSHNFVPDPLAGLAVPSVGTVQAAVSVSGNATRAINPGAYSAISVSGNGRLTMNPGIYVIAGGGFSVSGNGVVVAHGVSIVNAASSGGSTGSISFSGNGSFSLTPPATGALAGIAVYQPANNSKVISISGNAVSGVDGTIYAPKAQLSVTGNGTLDQSVIVDRLTISGNGSNLVAAEAEANQNADKIADSELRSGVFYVRVNDGGVALSNAWKARLEDAIATLNASLVASGIWLALAQAGDTQEDVRLHLGPSSPGGGAEEGVLGYALPSGDIFVISSWNWYTGVDGSAVGAGQYDYQTVLTHELAHAVGLGHSGDADSVMYASLTAGVARRSLTQADLDHLAEHPLADDSAGAGGGHALAAQAGNILSSPASVLQSLPGALASNNSREFSVDTIFGEAGLAHDQEAAPGEMLVELLSVQGRHSISGGLHREAARHSGNGVGFVPAKPLQYVLPKNLTGSPSAQIKQAQRLINGKAAGWLLADDFWNDTSMSETAAVAEPSRPALTTEPDQG